MCARSCQLLLQHVCDYNVALSGWVTEWLIVHAWKACVPKGTGGSNPPPSAPARFQTKSSGGARLVKKTGDSRIKAGFDFSVSSAVKVFLSRHQQMRTGEPVIDF